MSLQCESYDDAGFDVDGSCRQQQQQHQRPDHYDFYALTLGFSRMMPLETSFM